VLKGKLKLKQSLRKAMKNGTLAAAGAGEVINPEREKAAEIAAGTPVLRSLEKAEMQHARFSVIGHEALPEGDGMAKRLRIKLPLPAIDTNRSLSLPERQSDLLRLPVSVKPLAKAVGEPIIISPTVVPLLEDLQGNSIASAPDGRMSPQSTIASAQEAAERATSSKSRKRKGSRRTNKQ